MYFIILVLGLFFQVSEEYEEAYNLISQDSTKSNFIFGEADSSKNRIYVADTVLFFERTFFLDELIDIEYGRISKSKKQKIRNDEYLKQIKKNRNFKGYRLIELNNFNKEEDQDFILFFSELENGILMAELFAYPKTKIVLNDLRSFNSSIVYLFYFNTQGELQKFFKQETNYN